MPAVLPFQMLLCLQTQGKEVVQMAFTSSFSLTTLQQTVMGVLADGLQHLVAGVCCSDILQSDHQRFIYQLAQQPEDLFNR